MKLPKSLLLPKPSPHLNKVITLKDYLKDNDILYRSELTDEVMKNAQDLLSRVNRFLAHMLYLEPKVSSGWRPKAKNTAVNGAKSSYHVIGKAVDLADPQGILGYRIQQNLNLLEDYGLWMEHLQATPTWVHLDTGTRASRNVRTFLP